MEIQILIVCFTCYFVCMSPIMAQREGFIFKRLKDNGTVVGKVLTTYRGLHSYSECLLHCVDNSVCSTGRYWEDNGTCILYVPPGNPLETTPAYIHESVTFSLNYIWMGYEYDTGSGMCIKLVTSSPSTWNEAAERCAADRAQLVKINSQAKHDFVISVILGEPILERYFIGLNDVKSEGKFIWTDGTDADYRNFSPGQPGGGTTENCARMNTKTQLWGDIRCDLSYAYICEIRCQ